MFKSFITKVDEWFEIQGASIQNLENQVGQIANQKDLLEIFQVTQ